MPAVLRLEDNAAAGDTALGFRQFGSGYGGHLDTVRGKKIVRAREPPT
jgi:hypothetical protein